MLHFPVLAPKLNLRMLFVTARYDRPLNLKAARPNLHEHTILVEKCWEAQSKPLWFVTLLSWDRLHTVVILLD